VDDDPLSAFGLGAASLGVALAALFVIALARSHATYWVGRGLARGARAVHPAARDGAPARAATARLQAWTSSRTAVRGLERVRRWGPVAVTFAFLTVGVQTAVFVSAGLVRMRYVRFAVATIPGAAAWAVIWATVGLSAVWGAVRLVASSPWAAAALTAAAPALVGVALRRRRTRAGAPAPSGPADGYHERAEHHRHQEYDEHGRHVRSVDDLLADPGLAGVDAATAEPRPTHATHRVGAADHDAHPS